ncbi:MAG: PAS domain-containing protein [Blastocatellia bacterium]
MNEELRSAAEELETSKEELQSINEELTTVNQELKIKIEETTLASNNLQNLINSTDIGTVFLDRSFRVVLFTPAARQLFNLIPADYGRPLSDITHRLAYADLLHDAETVLEKLQPIEREVHTTDERTFLMRVLPYRTADDRIQGIVITFMDMTERKRSEELLAEDLRGTQILQTLALRLVTEENIQTIYDEIMTAAIEITRADTGTVQMLDGETEELIFLASSNITPRMLDFFRRVDATSSSPCGIALKTGARSFVHFDQPGTEDTDGGFRLHVEAGLLSAQSTPLIARSGKPLGMVSTHWRKAGHRPTERELRFLDLLARQAADLIEQRQAAKAQHESEEKYRSIFSSIDEGFCILEMIFDQSEKAIDFRYIETNQAFERLTGNQNVAGRLCSEVSPDPEGYWLETYGAVARTGEPQRIENYNAATGGWYSSYASRIGGAGSRQVALVFDNITERKREEQRQELILKLSDTLRPLADPIASQEVAVRMLGTHLGVDRCYYAEFDWPRDVLYIHHEYTRQGAVSAIGAHPISLFNDLLVHVIRASRSFATTS